MDSDSFIKKMLSGCDRFLIKQTASYAQPPWGIIKLTFELPSSSVGTKMTSVPNSDALQRIPRLNYRAEGLRLKLELENKGNVFERL